ncbi:MULTISPECIES: RHS repeat-associated core domain-containing protein [unclassified Paenibacillus]|uniref:RHS repeat domain-containing protein n=1 Tax=unclassified Paenibacillus TaxID=185978 RepID=UPI0030CCB484
MRINLLLKRLFIILLSVSILLPNYPANAAYSNEENTIIDSNNELTPSTELTVQENIEKPREIPQDLVAVVGSVYDPQITESIAQIEAFSLERKELRKAMKKGLGSLGRGDLTNKEIETLALSGAGIEDIYWINMLVKDTELSPIEILNVKIKDEYTWEEVDFKLQNKEFELSLSVNDVVYRTHPEVNNSERLITISEAVYKEEIYEGQLDQGLIKQEYATFSARVNGVFNGLYNQQQINQTNKQQYSDRSQSGELIDSSSGSLTWKENEISLPGRDGLDLNVGIMYNSNQSYGYQRSDAVYGNLKKFNYLNSRYDLGLGWSFQFPSVQLEDGYMFYHNGQGAVYRIDLYASDSLGSYTHLVGYQGKDMQFMQDSAGSYSNGQVSSAYYLQYADKKREYFASDGRLLGIVDRFGNAIKFEHTDRQTYDGGTHKVISRITDSLHRTVNFAYESTLNTTDTFIGEKIELTVNGPNGNEVEKVAFLKMRIATIYNGNPDGYMPYLWRITNQNNEITYLTHSWTETAPKFDFNLKYVSQYSGYNFYTNLTKVEYPKSTSVYEYELTTRNLGPYGFCEEFRVTSRKDVLKNSYNYIKYEYTGDYTGFPSYPDSNYLPESYTFSSSSILQSTSATNNLLTKTTFNGLQQNISKVSQAFNGERKEERYSNFHPSFKYLPTKTTYADFAVGDNDNTANMLYSETSYTDWGGVQSQTQPLSLSQFNDSSTKAKYTTSFVYEPNYHSLVSKSWYQNESTSLSESYEYYDNGRVKTYRNPKNEVTTYTYEPVPTDGRKISKVTEEKPMQNGLVARVATIYGPESNYAYPTEQISYFTNSSANGDKMTSFIQKKMAYDMGSGRMSEETDANGKATKYKYDKLGRVTSITYPTITNLNGEKYDVEDLYTYAKAFFYTSFDSIFDVENRGIYYLQVSYSRKYTQRSNSAVTYLSRQSTYYDGLGLQRLEQIIDTGAITQYHVDDLSRAVYVKDPVDNVTTVKYNAWGEQSEASDTYGNLYVNERNLKLRKVTNYVVAASGVEAYRANINNPNLKSSYVEQTYDQWGRLASTQVFKGWPNQSQPLSELYSYDIVGNNVTYTDPNKNLNNEGVTTKYTYDALNRLNSVKDALGQTTSYQYDRNGQITETTMHNSQTGASINLKSKTYNELGLLNDKKDVALQNENHLYNQIGLLTQMTDRNGTVSTYQYDERNQQVSSLLTGSGGNTQQSKGILGSNGIKSDTMEIYLNGVKTASQTTTIDNLKRLTNSSSQATGYTASTGYVYDKANRTTRLMGTHSGVGSFYTNYQYSMQRLNKVQVDGKSSLNDAATVNATYGYFPTGQVKTITYPTLTDGTTLITEYTYDALNRISTMTNKKSSWVLSSYTYLYDNNGNTTSVIEVLNNGAGKTTSYEYDKLNRLTKVVRPDGGGTTTYVYDLQGNRQIESNTSSNQSELSNTNYTYDLQNTLTKVIKDSSSTTIDYLPNGLRYQKTSDAVKTQYNYNGNGVVISESKSNGEKANYIRGDRLLVKKDVTTVKDYYYLYNGHGDVVQIVDTNGTVVNSYTYDVWGNIVHQTEGISNSFKYAGEIYDEETGLYYLRARYYDPSIGRFINEDTYEGQIDNPLSLNLYTYTINNPLKFIDPSGHKPIVGDGMIIDNNQYKYLVKLAQSGNSGAKSWAVNQLLIGAYYKENTSSSKSGSAVTQEVIKNTAGGVADAAFGKVLSTVPDTKKITISMPGLGPAAQVEAIVERSGVKMVKGVSKLAGPASLVFTGVDLYTDLTTYKDADKWKAAGITVLAAGTGVVTSVVIATATAPVIVTFGAAVAVGTAIGMAGSYIKDHFLEKK